MSLRALRLDDVGASSKRWEVYSKTRWANVGPFKYLRPWKAWGPYPELDAATLTRIFLTVANAGSRMTVGVTACWVERDGRLTPFHEKYPDLARMIEGFAYQGVIEVANHGLTHCQVGRHLPRFFHGNREMHREFVPGMLPVQVACRLHAAQARFSEWLDTPPTTLIPPGRMIQPEHVEIARDFGLAVMPREMESECLTFHDRDFVLYPKQSFARLDAAVRGEQFTTVGDALAERARGASE